MADDRLSKFAGTLLDEATAEKNKIEDKLKEKRNRRLNTTDEKLRIHFDSAVKLGITELKHRKQLFLTKREEELRRTLLKNRQKTLETVFSEVESNVRAFTKTPEYKEMLKNEFESAALYFKNSDGNTICTVMESDLELAKELFTLPNIKFICSDRDFLGGFTLENSALRLFADCTLENKVEEQKQLFYKTKELIFD